MIKKLSMMALLSLFSLAAFSVSLTNKDSKSYNIKVKSSSTYTGSINGGTTKGNVCSSCTIEISGVGSISASGSDRVVIKNGRVSK